MKLEKIIAVRNNKTIYRDGEKVIKLFDESFSKSNILNEALNQAQSQDLDLVMIATNPVAPVCKIMNYGKFRYEQQKKDKEARKNQKVVEIKEIRTSVRVQDHDLNFKIKNIEKFIADGDKVKVSVRFRGREMAYIEKGKDLLLKMAGLLSENCVIDKEPKLEGRNYVMYVAPKK